MPKVDLSRYGIFNNAIQSNHDLNCLELALKNANVNIDSVRHKIRTRNIPKKDIKIICEDLKIKIHLVYIDKHGKTKTENIGKGNITIKLALIDEHYILNEQTNYTSYSIKNYNIINHLPDWNRITKKNGNIFRREKDCFITSFAIVKILLSDTVNNLTKITLSNGGIDSHFNDRLFDYIELIAANKENSKLCENYQPQQLFIEKGKPKDFQIIFYDFEACTDGAKHEAFMICDSRGRCFTGEFCALNWLKSLECNALCIAHNSAYDLQFIIKYLYKASDLIKTGSKIKQIRGEFNNLEKN